MKLFRSLITGICVLGASVSALANDGSIVPGIGGSVELMSPENQSIRMLRERVDAVLDGERADVRCVFVFKNEGKAVTAMIGFPDVTYNSSEEAMSAEPASGMRYFKSWVDGKPVDVRYVRGKPAGRDAQYYKAWRVKSVHFDPGQVRRIVVKYGSRVGGHQQGALYDFEYILKTGASWKGRIGKVVVRVRVKCPPHVVGGDGRAYKLVMNAASPTGYRRHGDTLVWTLENVEPVDDIHVRFVDHVVVTGLDLMYEAGDYAVVDGVVMANLGSCSRITLVKHPKQGSCRVVYGEQRLKLFHGSRWAVLNGSRRIPLPEVPIFETRDETTWIKAPIAAIVRALGGRADYYRDTWNVVLSLPPLPTLNGQGLRKGLSTIDCGVLMMARGHLYQSLLLDAGVTERLNVQGGRMLIRGSKSILLFPDSRTAVVDGKRRVSLPRSCRPGLDGDIDVPAAAVVRALGGEVAFNAKTKKIVVRFPPLKKAATQKKVNWEALIAHNSQLRSFSIGKSQSIRNTQADVA